MSLENMRQKYMNLLNQQSDQNESDNEQWQMAYNKMKKNRSKIIQAQSILGKGSVKQNNFSEGQKLIQIKEKLGQCIQNLTSKEAYIQVIKKKYNQSQMQLVKAKKQIYVLCRKNQEIEERLKLKQEQFEIQIQKLHKQWEKQKIDNQLKTQQIEFYQNEIKKLNHDIMKKEQQIYKMEQEQTKGKKYKKENQRLRMDVQRLFKIINKFEKQKKQQQIKVNPVLNTKQFKFESSVNRRKSMNSFSNRKIQQSLDKSLKGKHYIGKPLRNQKQFKRWCPQILINQVQYFLKTQHIGYNNKIFVQNLVKFIEQYTIKQKQSLLEKLNKKYRYMKSQQSRKYNHSLSIRQIRQSTLKMLNLSGVNPLKQSSLFDSKTSKSNKFNENFIRIQRSSLNGQQKKSQYFYSHRMNKQNIRKYRTQLGSKKITQNEVQANNQKIGNCKIEVQTQDLCKNLQNSLKMNNIVKRIY